jgi:hypothetical protein
VQQIIRDVDGAVVTYSIEITSAVSVSFPTWDIQLQWEWEGGSVCMSKYIELVPVGLDSVTDEPPYIEAGW